ncbi:hypothetical protein C8255_12960 [filamentous cyanobacterium CCP3]|nr:hypothetical protein C8255_12960 [filamentous cyanobacterium CCP3]
MSTNASFNGQNMTALTLANQFVLDAFEDALSGLDPAALVEAIELGSVSALLNFLNNSGLQNPAVPSPNTNEPTESTGSGEEPSENTGSDQNAAVLTPVSDFVFNFRDDPILWGRHGNDVLLGFDPAAPTPVAPAPGEATLEDFKWNILLGDFLDENILGSRRFYARPEETGVNGQDRFILGDWRKPYYLDNYTAGSQQAAVVLDFQPELDTIQLHGSREDYILFRFPITFPPTSEDGEPKTFRGKALVYIGKDPETNAQDFDLIAFFPNIPPRSIDPSPIGGIPLPEFDLDGDYFDFVGNTPPPGPAEPGIKQLGTKGVDIGTGISVDPFGNVYVTGVTTGILGESNQGSYDFWVAKYDSNGNQEWIRQYGTTKPDITWDIQTFLTQDGEVNFYLTGSTTGVISDALGGSTENDGYQDIWVGRFNSEGKPVLDSNGDPVFVKQNAQQFNRTNSLSPLGSEIDNSLQIDVGPDGTLYQSGVTVELTEDAQQSGVQDFAWVASFDPEGNQRWINDDSLDSAEGFGFDESYGIALASDGTVFASGFTQLNISGPDQLIGVYDAWISRFDKDGNQIFIKQFGSINYDFSWGVDTDSEDNAYIVGATAGDVLGPDGNPVATNAGFYDIFLAKFSKEGNYEWAIQFGTEGDDAQYLGDIVIDNFDNIYITGFTNSSLGGPNQGGYDTWVASYDTNGNRNWITQFGSSRQDNPTALAVDNKGSIYVTGLTEGSLGNINQGSADAWIAKLDAQTGALQNFGLPMFPNVINGTPGNDVLYGTHKDDKINALAGDDIVYGLGGNDQINGGKGNDTIYSGDGNDTIYGGEGDDLIYAGNGNNYVDGGKGNDTIYGGNGNDTIKGGEGDDTIYGSDGDNDLSGGKGNDTIYGGHGNDTIKGGEGDDLIYVGNGNNYIDGGKGNDTIYGGHGNDTIKGGEGDDTIYGSDGDNDLSGGKGNDTIYGGNGNDTIKGGEGDDTIYGGNGNNYIDGGKGNDTIYAGHGNDTIKGGEGDDLIYAGNGNNHIDGGKGNDTIYGGKDDDTIYGGKGNDLIYGGNGNNYISGGEGNDTIYGGDGDDFLFGDKGNDIIYAGDGNNYVDGGEGNDIIYGGKGNDTLIGGAGNDIVYGGGGDNLFIGGEGFDQLYGDSGRDTFVLGNDEGSFYTRTGDQDFALIIGFDRYEDVIQLFGSASNYVLQQDVSHLPSGTAIFQKENNELIGVVAYQHLSFNGPGFEFLG